MPKRRTYSPKNQEPLELTRWWWPGQWLQFVFAIWVNQAWYHQNVLPLMHSKRRRSILIQAMLGATILTLVLTTTESLFLEAAGTKAGWETGLPAVFGSLLFAGVFAGWKSGRNCVVDGVLWGMGLSTGTVLAANLSLGFGNEIKMGVAGGVGLGCVIGLAIGVGYGIHQSLTQGLDSNDTPFALSGILAALSTVICLDLDAITIVGLLAALVSSSIIAALAAYVGNRWATRQIPDTGHLSS